MAIKRVLSTLHVDIPRPREMLAIPTNLTLVNINPYVPFPLTNIEATKWGPKDGVVCEATLAQDFIERTILSRGRPHFSLTHAAFIDDAIAVSSLTGATGETYGERYRYVEFDVAASFHREAFPKGSVRIRQFGTVEVDEFIVRWEVLPTNNRTVLQRGIFRVSVLGTRNGDQIKVASVEGSYMRRKAIHAIH